MKKIFLLFAALTIICGPMVNDIFAQENDPVLVCHFEENEDGEMIEVCEEISNYQLCSPECWDT